MLQGAQLSWVSDLQEEMASLYAEVLSVAAEARRADQRQQQQQQELSVEAARVGQLEHTLRKAEAQLQTKGLLLADDREMLQPRSDQHPRSRWSVLLSDGQGAGDHLPVPLAMLTVASVPSGFAHAFGGIVLTTHT